MQRRTFLTGLMLTAAATVASPHGAMAVIVECANCSTMAQQLLGYARQAQQLATQVSQYQTTLRQYANMVQNTIALPQMMWADVQGNIMQVRSIANAASLLTGNSGSILTRLNSASGYAGQITSVPGNISGMLSMWQNTLGNGVTTLGRTLGVQQGQEQSYTALQRQLQAQSQSATGQMQAIQAGNELAALTNTQLQQIQTTLVAAAQEQATRDAVLADRQAQEDAASLAGLQYKPLNVTGEAF